MKRGKFIVFEGADGAGKTTQLKLAAEWLRSDCGIAVLETREPGGTTFGEELRAIVKNSSRRLDKTAELFLFLAARREHVLQKILPALESGMWVLCDRFSDSTRAYQGGGRGMDADLIERATSLAEEGARPDCTIYLLGDGAKNTAAPLLSSPSGGDAFEQSGARFAARVAAQYRKIAKANKTGAIVRINKKKEMRPRQEIANEIRDTIKTTLRP